ncbi:hypothetical protein O0I10_000813 [Lichtheimia ornata]|uniref:Uncharacterized protein n=1 Tax=Lichtheimia ornata TaxID=688661 RepID=A0AAD8DIK8_9FUNG|nr:uncharacterized protein O0I10_000813 [Lichtheimia ornata]KAJ8663570.1 hypothetical protein O0I10_000813 [Lichtheimia ornata]
MLTTKACGLVLLVISHCVYGRLNMLDDGSSGSNRMRISKQECCMVGSMVCMDGIGFTKRNLLINETYSETAARQYG